MVEAVNNKRQVETSNIDELIGRQIKAIRTSYGMSQMALAEKIGLSFQQVQKYEKGTTRISVFRLQQISDALEVNITAFFTNIVQTTHISNPSISYMEARDNSSLSFNKEGVMFLKLFRQIKSKKVRAGFLKQLRGIIELEVNQLSQIHQDGE